MNLALARRTVTHFSGDRLAKPVLNEVLPNSKFAKLET